MVRDGIQVYSSPLESWTHSTSVMRATDENVVLPQALEPLPGHAAGPDHTTLRWELVLVLLRWKEEELSPAE